MSVLISTLLRLHGAPRWPFQRLAPRRARRMVAGLPERSTFEGADRGLFPLADGGAVDHIVLTALFGLLPPGCFPVPEPVQGRYRRGPPGQRSVRRALRQACDSGATDGARRASPRAASATPSSKRPVGSPMLEDPSNTNPSGTVPPASVIALLGAPLMK